MASKSESTAPTVEQLSNDLEALKAERTALRQSMTGVNVRKSPEHPNASTNNVTLAITKYDNNVSTRQDKEGNEIRTHWLDAEILQTPGANENLPRQSNPHLYYKNKGADSNGRNRIDTAVPYTDDQFNKVVENAIEAPALNAKGERVGSVYIVNADIQFKRDRPNIFNSKTLSPAPEGLTIPENIKEAQFQAVAPTLADTKEKYAEVKSAYQSTSAALEQAQTNQVEAGEVAPERDNKGRFIKKEEPAKTADEPSFG